MNFSVLHCGTIVVAVDALKCLRIIDILRSSTPSLSVDPFIFHFLRRRRTAFEVQFPDNPNYNAPLPPIASLSPAPRLWTRWNLEFNWIRPEVGNGYSSKPSQLNSFSRSSSSITCSNKFPIDNFHWVSIDAICTNSNWNKLSRRNSH